MGFTVREKYVLRVFGNKVLREIFGPKRDEATVLEKRRCIFCTARQILLKVSRSGRVRWTGHQSTRRDRRGA